MHAVRVLYRRKKEGGKAFPRKKNGKNIKKEWEKPPKKKREIPEKKGEIPEQRRGKS